MRSGQAILVVATMIQLVVSACGDDDLHCGVGAVERDGVCFAADGDGDGDADADGGPDGGDGCTPCGFYTSDHDCDGAEDAACQLPDLTNYHCDGTQPDPCGTLSVGVRLSGGADCAEMDLDDVLVWVEGAPGFDPGGWGCRFNRPWSEAGPNAMTVPVGCYELWAVGRDQMGGIALMAHAFVNLTEGTTETVTLDLASPVDAVCNGT